MFFLGRIEGQQHIVKQSSTKMTDADGELFEIKFFYQKQVTYLISLQDIANKILGSWLDQGIGIGQNKLKPQFFMVFCIKLLTNRNFQIIPLT